MSDLLERLDAEARDAHRAAWRCRNGGLDYTIGAMLAEEAAARIRELVAENERLRGERERLAQIAEDCPVPKSWAPTEQWGGWEIRDRIAAAIRGETT